MTTDESVVLCEITNSTEEHDDQVRMSSGGLWAVSGPGAG